KEILDEKEVQDIKQLQDEEEKIGSDGEKERNRKSIEQAIRNYVLNKFPSSKNLYDHVLSYSFRNDQLIYVVDEKGYAFSKVMRALFVQTQEAFYKQTKIKITIKFELKPSQVVDKVDEGQEKLDKIKEFFGPENIEIIE
ncbi:MAG: hypothetical protein Q4E50_05890, partial [Tissierellia bacterium]|nr:hypothetical protein [Tissierellia bacterium]